jgi:hypothetical protein
MKASAASAAAIHRGDNIPMSRNHPRFLMKVTVRTWLCLHSHGALGTSAEDGATVGLNGSDRVWAAGIGTNPPGACVEIAQPGVRRPQVAQERNNRLGSRAKPSS